MYKEELEEFDEAENTPPSYISTSTPQDAEKLARENERLKKSLEKEKFFNKLLDQELKDAKAEASTRIPADFIPERRGVSKGAFYTVLFLALALAGFVIYNSYSGEKNPDTTISIPADTDTDPAPSAQQNTPAPAATDTVPEIIATAPATVKATEPVKKAATPPPVADDAEEDIIEEPVIKEKTVQKSVPAPAKPAPAVVEETATTPPVESAPPPAQPSRPVIATYKVTSKANFYNSADENTLRSSFINGGNKTVNALEDKNGFIYVEYTNEHGMMNRGWLSKKDLTQE